MEMDDLEDQGLDYLDEGVHYLDATDNLALQRFVGDWKDHIKPLRRLYDGQSTRNLRRKAEHTRQALAACPMQPLLIISSTAKCQSPGA